MSDTDDNGHRIVLNLMRSYAVEELGCEHLGEQMTKLQRSMARR